MTKFQHRLKSYIWGERAKEGHWFLRSGTPRLVKPPNYGGAITIKRALYAAFLGDVEEGMELRARCGAEQCANPWHQLQEPGRSPTPPKGVHLPDLFGEESDETPGTLPQGVKVSAVAAIKALGDAGSSLEHISAVVDLDKSTVMKARAGVYDKAVASLRRGQEARRRNKNQTPVNPEPKVVVQAQQTKGSEVELAFDVKAGNFLKVVGAPEEPDLPPEEKSEDSEVVAWIRSMG